MKETKQIDINTTIPPKDIYNIGLYSLPITLAQYLIYNLFRILRPLRYKYGLTINELVILNGIGIYNKHVSTSFTKSSIRRFNGYFNNNKSDYYIKSLLLKECIIVSDIIKGIERYKLTSKGIEVINQYEKSYKIALDKFITDNNIIV